MTRYLPECSIRSTKRVVLPIHWTLLLIDKAHKFSGWSQVAEIAERSTDGAARAAACEFLHAATLKMLGIAFSQPRRVPDLRRILYSDVKLLWFLQNSFPFFIAFRCNIIAYKCVWYNPAVSCCDCQTLRRGSLIKLQ